MTYTIREATEDDFLDVMMLVKQFSKEAPSMYFWNAGKAEEVVRGCIDGEHHGILLLEIDSVVRGMLMYVFIEIPFTGSLMLSELAWFVEKEYRGHRGSLSLLEEYEAIGDKVGVDYVQMSDIQPMSSLEKLYTRRGYEKMETSYVRKV